MRALFCYEINQSVRRKYKNEDNQDVLIKQRLDELLGIEGNCEQTRTAPQPLFVPELASVRDLPFFDTVRPSRALMKELLGLSWYVAHAQNLPQMLAAVVFSPDPVSDIRRLPKPSRSGLARALCLPPLTISSSPSPCSKEEDNKSPSALLAAAAAATVPTTRPPSSSLSAAASYAVPPDSSATDTCQVLDDYELCVLAQSLQYNTKADRVDSDNKCMRISELVNREVALETLRIHVRDRHRSRYTSDLVRKYKLEKDEIAHRMAQEMVACDSLDEFVKLFRYGKRIGSAEHSFTNSSSLGVLELETALLNESLTVPKRHEKAEIFLLGTTTKELAARARALHLSEEPDSKDKSEEEHNDKRDKKAEFDGETKRGRAHDVTMSSSSPSASLPPPPSKDTSDSTDVEDDDTTSKNEMVTENDASSDRALVWNQGNVQDTRSMTKFAKLFMHDEAHKELWKSINAELAKHMYMYRGSNTPNRHTHCNAKPSYWAMRFQTVRAFYDYCMSTNPARWTEYKALHTTCCGVPLLPY